MKSAEQEEQGRLAECLERIRTAMRHIDERLAESGQDIQKRQNYMMDARRDMEHIKKIAVRYTIEQTVRSSNFNHSPLKSLIFGSRTTEILRSATVPTLLLR